MTQSKDGFQENSGTMPDVSDGQRVTIRLNKLVQQVNVAGFKSTPSIDIDLMRLEVSIAHSWERLIPPSPTRFGESKAGLPGQRDSGVDSIPEKSSRYSEIPEIEYSVGEITFEIVVVPEVTEIKVLKRQCIQHAKYNDGSLKACDYDLNHDGKHSFE